MARLLLFDLESPYQSLHAVSAAVQAGEQQLLVYFGGARAVDARLLHWVTHCFDVVAKHRPRLDLVPLVPGVGWSLDRAATLPDLAALAVTATGEGVARRTLQQLAAQRSAAGVAGELQLQLLPDAPEAAAMDEERREDEAQAASLLVCVQTGQEGCACPGRPLQYPSVVVGGTFDRLHAGHRLLLAVTAIVAQREVCVGITDAAMLENKKHAELLQPYAARAAQVERYMTAVHPGLQVRSVGLVDARAPTPASLEPQLHAIVVSRETVPGAQAINKDRVQRGFAPLAVVAVGLVGLRKGAPASEKLSSTSLREADAAAQL